PCIECNRSIKFDRLLERAGRMGFESLATGHHARITRGDGGVSHRLRRGADPEKDQSYVLSMLGQAELARVMFPVGNMTKRDVRAEARRLGLRTAAKPDSQDVCFVSRIGGRQAFLGNRIPLRPGVVVDSPGTTVGTVPAVELVTVGQRRGLGTPSPPPRPATGGNRPSPTKADRQFVTDVDMAAAVVTIGPLEDLLVDELEVTDQTWVEGPVADGAPVEVQTSAHGRPIPARWQSGRLHLAQPIRRVAPGQSVVLYEGDRVLGGGIATDRHGGPAVAPAR
ncbi:MAG: tRNA 2-thiouridine(34) synthase MnmA, partial [Actinomycetota bacterium]|nr:tRNA 2-thiouridine(34) synthase MnmA [Actinomycetota bacterium]